MGLGSRFVPSGDGIRVALQDASLGSKTGSASAGRGISVLPPRADIGTPTAQVRFVPIVLKKSFWGDERNYLELLIRFERGDVRDHIDSSKIDHGPS